MPSKNPKKRVYKRRAVIRDKARAVTLQTPEQKREAEIRAMKGYNHPIRRKQSNALIKTANELLGEDNIINAQELAVRRNGRPFADTGWRVDRSRAITHHIANCIQLRFAQVHPDIPVPGIAEIMCGLAQAGLKALVEDDDIFAGILDDPDLQDFLRKDFENVC